LNEISSPWPSDVPAGTTAVDLFYCEGAGALVVVVHDREMNHHLYFRPISGEQPYRPLVERTGTKDSFLEALPDPAGNFVYYLGYGEHSTGQGWDFNGVFRVSIGGKPECLVSSAEFGRDVFARGFASKLLGFDSSGEIPFHCARAARDQPDRGAGAL
jgi:hypothetical protein